MISSPSIWTKRQNIMILFIILRSKNHQNLLIISIMYQKQNKNVLKKCTIHQITSKVPNLLCSSLLLETCFPTFIFAYLSYVKGRMILVPCKDLIHDIATNVRPLLSVGPISIVAFCSVSLCDLYS